VILGVMVENFVGSGSRDRQAGAGQQSGQLLAGAAGLRHHGYHARTWAAFRAGLPVLL